VKIPLSSPDIGDLEIEYVSRVLRSNHLSLGPVLAEFEEKFAAYAGTKYAIACSSGTAALHMCVRALGFGSEAEVITSSFSFVASVNCLLYEEVFPRLLDIDPETLNLDPNLIREFLLQKCTRNRGGEVISRESGRIVKAILPVHVFGLPVDMQAIGEIASEYGLAILEDACEAIGAEFRGRRVGTFGNAAVFAFYPNKQMTTGEGGMIVTDDAKIAERCRSLRNQGRDADGRWLKHVCLGYNYRLSDIQAALGLAQLERIDDILGHRASVAERYLSLLRSEDSLTLPETPSHAKRSWFVFVIRTTGPLAEEKRDVVRAHLADRGIASQIYFPPIHCQPYFKELEYPQTCDLAVTESVSKTCLAIPFATRLSNAEIQFVAASIREALNPGLSSILQPETTQAFS
jgi:dTDP-4-amino-4,6-dideoxygalactose transaminase